MSDLAYARTRPRILSDVKPDDEVAFVASAQQLFGSAREAHAVQYKSWQQELWAYSKSVGEYGSVMDWFASGISRMHLRAARWHPDLREPELLTDGPAVRLVNRLVANAKGGETQYLYKWGRHLGIAGVGYFVGYQQPNGREVFDVKSADQIRRSNVPFREGDDGRGAFVRDARGRIESGYDLRVAQDEWIKLPRNQLVNRIFRPDDEYDYEPSSWTRAALTTLREIDLFNRHIVATLLSRLVFNGILFIPQEITFPVNPQFKDAPDPFIAELIATAQRGIRDPGSPGSAIPLPLRVPAQFIDNFKHLILATGVDPKVVDARAQAVTRLSEQLPAPPEAMTGKSKMNDWSAWKDEQDNIKMYFGPTMEILVGGLTETYLHPLLVAGNQRPMGKDGSVIVVWYDSSDLTSDPDNSENAKEARANISITEESYLEALNLDAADKPTDEQRKKMILTDLARQGLPPTEAYYLLYPGDRPPPMPTDPAAGLPPNAGPSGAARPAAAAPRQPVAAGASSNGRASQAPSVPKGA